MSHNVLYMRGQVAELRGNVDEARRWYEEALSISPTHVKSMQRLVSLGAPLGGSSSSGPSAHVLRNHPDALGRPGGPGGPSLQWSAQVELLRVGSAQPAWAPGPCEGRVWVRGLGPAGQATLWPRA